MQLSINFSNKRTILGIMALICAIAVIFYLPTLISYTNPQTCTVDGVCQHEQRLIFLTEMVPVFVIIGVVIGAVVFFFMASKLDNRQKELQNVSNALIQFLNRDEKLVVQKLLENNGKVLQAEISRMEGLGKVRSHRVIQKLVDRGVIEVEKYGKTNTVKLTKAMSDSLVFKK